MSAPSLKNWSWLVVNPVKGCPALTGAPRGPGSCAGFWPSVAITDVSARTSRMELPQINLLLRLIFKFSRQLWIWLRDIFSASLMTIPPWVADWEVTIISADHILSRSNFELVRVLVIGHFRFAIEAGLCWMNGPCRNLGGRESGCQLRSNL